MGLILPTDTLFHVLQFFEARDFTHCIFPVQRISPEGSSKIQLQTVLHDGNSYSFHFVNNSYPGSERRDRDEVKDLLAQLIPAHRKKANKDLEEKTK